MEDAQRLRITRRSCRTSVTKLLAKVEEVMTCDLSDVNSEVVTESRRLTFSTTLSRLNTKKDEINKLDSRISATIQHEEELETELTNADNYLSELEEKIAIIKEFIKKASQPPVVKPPTRPPSVTVEQRPTLASAGITTVPQLTEVTTTPEVSADTLPETEVTKKPSRPSTTSSTHVSSHTLSDTTEHTRDMYQTYTRLPKLPLPTFDGNPLHWQMFWDSFTAAVHSNPCLTPVQKLNYLRAQLHGDAARVIGDFPLSDSNYPHCVTLLRERFGQQYKLVDAHMEALLNVSPPSNSLTSLQAFYDTIQNHIRALSALGKQSDSYGPLLTTVILGKLPSDTKIRMARDHYDSEWTIHELLDSVLKEIRIYEAGQQSGRKIAISRTSPLPTTSSFHAGTQRAPHTRTTDSICAFCKGTHRTNSCTSVTSPKERLSIVKSAGLCFNCLARHKVSQCTSKFSCRHCNKKHHTSLCHTLSSSNDPTQSVQPSTSKSTNEKATNQAGTGTTTNQTGTTTTTETFTTVTSPPLSALYTSVCLLKTAIADISAGLTTVEGHILFDEGAQRSFITQELADTLQLQPTRHELITVSSFGEQVSTPKKFAVATICIRTLNAGQIPVSVLVVPKLAAPVRNSIRTCLKQLPYLKGLTLAHPVTSDDNFHISVLIGADYYWEFIQDHIVRGDGPTAVQSRLGYLLSGPLPVPQSIETTNLRTSALSCITEETQHDTLWQVESFGTTPSKQNPESDFLQEYMASKITVRSDGAYSLKFPWKNAHPPLPTNYGICIRRTRSMIYRLARSPKLLKMYDTIIKEQEARGFIEKVNHNDEQTSVHYIPHHPVRKESSTTPIRIVFDCSCRQSLDSPSLNDCLHPGPPSLNDLCGILIRFRQHNFAFSSDIEKAFLHVHLDVEDRDFTRFLWLSDPSDANSHFTTFRFKVVLFGATCSPFMLSATLTYHLTQNSSNTSQDLLRNLYVDNVVSGGQTETACVDYFVASRSILGDARFNLRSWTSNSTQLRTTAIEHNVAEGANPVKVLGLWWDTQFDLIYPSPKPDAISFTAATTKREILKWASTIFDPLGLISPVTISTKLFLQKLWQQQLDWDTKLSEELCTTWNKISYDVVQATELSFPRQCVSLPSTSETTIHGFADASPQAYGAVVYLLQGTCATIVMSKSRAAPLKPHSLPRLELMAAVVASRLCSFVLSSLNTTVPLCLWSDSQIVLSWIFSDKKLKPFVSNRVTEIRSVSTRWRYCPSTDNPADLLTRGITFEQLNTSDKWNHGPAWLISPPQWPTWQRLEAFHIQTAANELDEECQDVTPEATPVDTPGIHKIIDLTKFSNLSKLIAVTAYVCRFIHNCRQHDSRREGPLTVPELTQANLQWIRQVQGLTFAAEVDNLKVKGRRLPLVRQLRLFLDKDNLLRCGGRIHNAPISELAKFPYLLPSRHDFTILVIRNAHTSHLHSGINATLTVLRQRYWIPSARQRIKTVIRKCVVCKKTSGRPYAMPDPPPLIKSRVKQMHPFNVTGVDFTGALYVRAPEGERKVYICLFTCAVSRAVHLEIVIDLTVDSFLQAFRRFAGRRSVPQLLISDNGSTFLAAAEELKTLFVSTELSETLARKGTQWKFIPKRAPWFGGFWERLIGITKTTLKKTLGRTHVTLEGLQTIIVEVEALLNDRPLTYSSSDITDPEPISPSHLLHGRRIVTLPHLTVQDDELHDPDFGDDSVFRHRAKRQALLIQHFWNRWRDEYLTALRETHRTVGNNDQQVKTGDIVLVHDNTTRINWRLAVIESVNKGADGMIRSANIRTATGRTNRPIAKLYPLEVSAAEATAKPCTMKATEGGDTPVPSKRPMREAAKKGQGRVKEWITSLRGPPEDVMDND